MTSNRTAFIAIAALATLAAGNAFAQGTTPPASPPSACDLKYVDKDGAALTATTAIGVVDVYIDISSCAGATVVLYCFDTLKAGAEPCDPTFTMAVERTNETTIAGTVTTTRGHIKVGQTGKVRAVGFAKNRALAAAALSPEIHISHPAPAVAAKKPAARRPAAPAASNANIGTCIVQAVAACSGKADAAERAECENQGRAACNNQVAAAAPAK